MNGGWAEGVGNDGCACVRACGWLAGRAKTNGHPPTHPPTHPLFPSLHTNPPTLVLLNGILEASLHYTNGRNDTLVSFTGSTRGGKEVQRAAAGNLKRVLLECGGKSAAVVFDDVDVDALVANPGFVLISGILHAGQVCATASRLLVQARRCLVLHPAQHTVLRADSVLRKQWNNLCSVCVILNYLSM